MNPEVFLRYNRNIKYSSIALIFLFTSLILFGYGLMYKDYILVFLCTISSIISIASLEILRSTRKKLIKEINKK